MQDNDIIAERLAAWRETGNAFPNTFKRDTLAADLHELYADSAGEDIAAKAHTVRVAGRMMTKRVMGKASFLHLQDMSGQIQLYIKKADLLVGDYADFRQWHIGDILGACGTLFKTKTGELSIHVTQLYLLTKALRPLPEKFHGLADRELCYRQRYLDLISSQQSRNLFQTRSKVINRIREFLSARGFLEVETPMLHALAGGATARPFITHHNALDMPLYLRIAPELYLKRLVIGGFEQVFEINRSFRNEGLSTRHNPEFTMLEFYQAYADYADLMQLTEILLRELVMHLNQQSHLSYQGNKIDFAPDFTRLTMSEAVLAHNSTLQEQDLSALETLQDYARSLSIAVVSGAGIGKILTDIFEKTVEEKLLQPTFITHYPAEVSPLARRNDDDPRWVDRFELFIAGKELANGFSELNDPEDQAERFRAQIAAGEAEHIAYDEDYITALEYGLPPTAGEGIGIDRLLMLLTDASSIRDVILFPQLRHR